ncbi:sigma-70 family RNA polymerase sigma factor [Micromonospora zhanjiangensis]|uniref:Sigma-70 family RNA polymerase sigma factor n=1 Tax=Micromonospora zhanjiangensis TaxID=1522057 RepID=A0ABV8KNE7_9ACTN
MLQLWAYTGDHGQAQEVVQEAFCRAYPRWGRISRYDDPAAWVRRVAWNLATNRFRRAKLFTAFARRHRESHVDGPSPDRVVLVAALAALPERQRRALVKYHLGDFSVAEIAAAEGVAENTVKSWLHRGRAALAVALGRPEAEGRHD